MVFDRAEALSKYKFRYPYQLRQFASPNLWASICHRFRGGFVSGQTENKKLRGGGSKKNRIRKFEVESRK